VFGERDAWFLARGTGIAVDRRGKGDCPWRRRAAGWGEEKRPNAGG